MSGPVIHVPQATLSPSWRHRLQLATHLLPMTASTNISSADAFGIRRRVKLKARAKIGVLIFRLIVNLSNSNTISFSFLLLRNSCSTCARIPYFNRCHKAIILMAKNMAMIYKAANLHLVSQAHHHIDALVTGNGYGVVPLKY
jgi:hypothetical protein